MKRLLKKIKSDEAAALSGEMIMLIALSMFAVFAIYKYIIVPLTESSKNIGDAIGEMGPS